MQDQVFKDIFLERDRERLFEYGQSLFQLLRENHGISHIYFHLPDGTNFVRLHNKDIYGDKINRLTFRKSVEETGLGSGIELGKTAFALRTVLPYYNNGELIGYVEFGEEIDHFLNILKSETGNEFAIIADKEHLNREDWLFVRRLTEQPDNWDDMRGHVLLTDTIEDESGFLASKKCFTEEEIMIVEQGITSINFITSGKEHYVCSGFPILDPKGGHIGEVLVMEDVTHFVVELNKDNLIALGTSFALFFFGLLSISFIISRFVVMPILSVSNTARDIVGGDLSKRVQVESRDEVGDMANNFNIMTDELIKTQETSEESLKASEKDKEELERINKFMVGRELKMAELKEEIRELKKDK